MQKNKSNCLPGSTGSTGSSALYDDVPYINQESFHIQTQLLKFGCTQNAAVALPFLQTARKSERKQFIG